MSTTNFSLNPPATFDVLFLGRELQRINDGFTESDLQLLAYLSCLLSLFQERPVSDWGYGFAGTEFGAPFSPDIDKAVRHLERAGHFRPGGDRLLTKESAGRWLDGLSLQRQFSERISCLKAATSTCTSFSVGIIREAMDQETELGRVKRVDATRLLLDDCSLALVHDQFGNLRRALSIELSDLRLPAMVWIAALFEESQRNGGEPC